MFTYFILVTSKRGGEKDDDDDDGSKDRWFLMSLVKRFIFRFKTTKLSTDLYNVTN